MLVKTRLRAMDPLAQDRLINWGYAICDAALRAHCTEVLGREFGVALRNPLGLPYPTSGVGTRAV